MNKLIYELIEAIIAELNEPSTKEKLNTELVQPLIQYLTRQLYPYLISTCVIIILMFICVISILIMLIQGAATMQRNNIK